MRAVRNVAFFVMAVAAVVLQREVAYAYILESCDPPAYSLPHAVITVTDCATAGADCASACRTCHSSAVLDVVECTPYSNPSLGFYAVCQCSTIPD